MYSCRLCIRAKLVRDKYSGSFQFNSGEDKPILFSCSHNTNNSSNSRDTEEPQVTNSSNSRNTEKPQVTELSNSSET